MQFLRIFMLWMFLHSKITNMVHCQNAYNLVIRKFYWPEGLSEQKVQFCITPKNYVPGYQLVDMNYSSPIPLGNNAMVRFHGDLENRIGNMVNWVPLFTVNDGLCKIIDTFLGQFVYDMEIAVGMIPKSCPIPRGIYHAVNYTMNFRTLKLQTFPFGNLRITFTVVDKGSKEKLSNFVIILSNKED